MIGGKEKSIDKIDNLAGISLAVMLIFFFYNGL